MVAVFLVLEHSGFHHLLQLFLIDTPHIQLSSPKLILQMGHYVLYYLNQAAEMLLFHSGVGISAQESVVCFVLHNPVQGGVGSEYEVLLWQ